ncbi:rod shape-determining protein RodA [Dactylococcopsis salina]|uniref:Peptidoglycan glycosyltransferase RodA n=1 Tax=Dactylococcopsis salina (strain PCC 8305) TaxID=13035 RepID=K9YPU4_DACS8|nr:rod shape-determining protein RodA [Dactylococcopsis salina]AFZ48899.1 rod shape-determining protein RodA [Dactylococcopsis salina PCC 8305]
MTGFSFSKFSWRNLIAPWQEIDWFLLLLVVGVASWGALTIYSTQINEEVNDWIRHGIMTGIGLLIALFLARWRYNKLLYYFWLVYAVTNISLLMVLVMGVTAKGAQRWISVAGFNLQPSEFAKLGVIISLAAILHRRPAETLPALLQALLVVALPWGLVFLQPDLGTSLVFGAIALGMLYWANANFSWLLLLISPAVAAILFNVYIPAWLSWAGLMFVIAWRTLPGGWLSGCGAIALNFISGGLGNLFWGLLKDYQKNRLILFLDPNKDPLGGGYHLIQSRIAIGAGEMWGRGFTQGTQTQLDFIPEQHTDFIFSAVGEELGFVGTMGLLLLFWLICVRLLMIALKAQDNFGSLLAIGVFCMIFFQVAVNVGMTIGLAPITGLPLPWMSYGRSAILMNFMAIGIVESVANHKQRTTFFS